MKWIKIIPEMELPKEEVLAHKELWGKDYYLVGLLKLMAEDIKNRDGILCISNDFEPIILTNVSHYCLIEPPND